MLLRNLRFSFRNLIHRKDKCRRVYSSLSTKHTHTHTHIHAYTFPHMQSFYRHCHSSLLLRAWHPSRLHTRTHLHSCAHNNILRLFPHRKYHSNSKTSSSFHSYKYRWVLAMCALTTLPIATCTCVYVCMFVVCVACVCVYEVMYVEICMI